MSLFSKLNFTFFTIMFLLCSSASAKDLKFIQITDSHFSAGNSTQYTQREVSSSKKTLEQTVRDINSIPDLDFVIFTGDNIDQANAEDLKAFVKVANSLKTPYYMVIGNHEVFKSQNLDKKEYMKIVSKYSKNFKTRSANYSFARNGYVFLVVDGAKEVIPGPAGYFKKDTLKWLDKQLTKHKNDTVVIFQHFPLVEPSYHKSHTTYKPEDYFAVLKKHNNVIAIFSGHYHVNAEKMVDGIYHVSTPALVEPPHNFKIVEIEKRGKTHQIYTQLRHAE